MVIYTYVYESAAEITMPKPRIRGIKRDYDEYEQLKNQKVAGITEDNAQQRFVEAKANLIKKLGKLDVLNITQVEDLYLIAAQLTASASYLAAIQKAERKGTSFDQEISSIGTDDVAKLLADSFKDIKYPQNFHKIFLIDATYKPAKQSWAALHDKITTVARDTTQNYVMSSLTKTLPAYVGHLESKLKASGVDIEKPVAHSVMQDKMIKRYLAVRELRDGIANKEFLKPEDMSFAAEKITLCLDNHSDWRERPFIQKLTDVLTLGLKPLYRTLFSKEKEFQNTMTLANDQLAPILPPRKPSPSPEQTQKESAENAGSTNPEDVPPIPTQDLNDSEEEELPVITIATEFNYYKKKANEVAAERDTPANDEDSPSKDITPNL